MLQAYDDGFTCNFPSLLEQSLNRYICGNLRVLLSLWPYIASPLAPLSNLYIASDTFKDMS